MMSDTPRGKTILSQINSKYLSPCRTFGLKRKSSSPNLTGSKLLRSRDTKCTTPIAPKNGSYDDSCDSSHLKELSNNNRRKPDKASLKGRQQSDTPVRESKNVPPAVRLGRFDCPKKESESPARESKNLQPVVCLERIVWPKDENDLPDVTETNERKIVTRDDLRILIERINYKFERLDGLKRTQVYTKKHDLAKLQGSTETWKSGCRLILPRLLAQLNSNGQNITMSDILHEHHIPYELIGYNHETLDFE